MAEMAVSLVIDQLLPLLREEAKLLRGVHKEFADIKDELESIQAFLKDADKRAAAAEGDNNNETIKIWVKQVREAAFRIEDVVDEYMIHLAKQPCDRPRSSRYAALHYSISHWFKTSKQRQQIASEIQDIKSSVRGIKERSERYGFQRSFEHGSSSAIGNQNAKWHDPRMAALYIEEAEVVGFETQRNKLVDWLVRGRDERTVVSVVGMGGQGKTTLAKKVFDSKDVIGHFDCRLWITVSQSYNVEGLLRDLLLKLYKQMGDQDPPKGFYEMDRGSLTDEVRNNLQQKRYVVVFDDVWSVHFWDDIEFAVIDNKNGSKIIITTRNLDVVVSCKRSSFIEVLELQPLNEEQSFQLFNKKAFRFDYGGCCPKDLIDIAYKIVKKCKGLPLSIVAIGGLLSTRDKNVFEWQRFLENLSLELKIDTHLIGIKEILTLSYDDLPYYLKSCLLYFGIYPEDYEVRSKRVIRQWIAEGFVKEEKGKTLEDVAERYLTELVHRNLVQVSSLRNGKAKGCRVHDLIHDMVLEKNEDLNFCKNISDNGFPSLSGTIRRLSMTSTSGGFMDRIETSSVRSLLCFRNMKMFLWFQKNILTKSRLLKVLDCESASWLDFPLNLGNLIHLKYLSFKNVYIREVPKSIGMLQNLETLDVRDTLIRELPNEISKLRKLRHLIGTELSFVQVKDGIAEMTALQTLRNVNLGVDGAVALIKDLGKLKQLRDLKLFNFSIENGSLLSSSINEMQHLEKLNVQSMFAYDESIDLSLISPPTMIRQLTLGGRLQEFPELHNLVVLRLKFSYLTKDPMQSLKRLQHLLVLHIQSFISEFGLCLHFENGWFQKLKELYIENSLELRDVIIDKGALPSLKKLHLHALLGLENIPTGIQHLEKLEVLYISRMENEFVQNSSTTDDWNWIMEHVPFAEISTIDNRNVVRNARS